MHADAQGVKATKAAADQLTHFPAEERRQRTALCTAYNHVAAISSSVHASAVHMGGMPQQGMGTSQQAQHVTSSGSQQLPTEPTQNTTATLAGVAWLPTPAQSGPTPTSCTPATGAKHGDSSGESEPHVILLRVRTIFLLLQTTSFRNKSPNTTAKYGMTQYVR